MQYNTKRGYPNYTIPTVKPGPDFVCEFSTSRVYPTKRAHKNLKLYLSNWGKHWCIRSHIAVVVIISTHCWKVRPAEYTCDLPQYVIILLSRASQSHVILVQSYLIFQCYDWLVKQSSINIHSRPCKLMLSTCGLSSSDPIIQASGKKKKKKNDCYKGDKDYLSIRSRNY
jgi:hypothetical protein